MERLDEQALGAALDIQPAQCAKRHAAAGVEPVEDTVPSSIGSQFLLKRPEHFRLDHLELKRGLVEDPSATLDTVAPLATQAMREQPALVGQRLRSARCHLRERDPCLSPGDEMPSAGDGNRCLIVGPLDQPLGVHLKELRMETSPVELEDQLGNLWTNS